MYIRLPRLMSWLNESKRRNFYGGDINRARVLSPGWLSNKGPPVRRKLDTQVNAITRDCHMEDYFPPYSAGPFYVLSANTISSLFQNMSRSGKYGKYLLLKMPMWECWRGRVV